MLGIEENKQLTQVGPGTPMGELMRQYWHPVAAAAELDGSAFRTKEVRLLGEDLVLFRTRSGQLGLIERWCAHRRINLSYGVVEEDGLRCQYHGWKFNTSGECIEQPFEDTVHPDGTFKTKCSIKAYRAEEVSGLIFAYMGSDPDCFVPRWDALVRENAVRDIAMTELPANWMQCQENSLDPVHAEWLHGYFSKYLYENVEVQKPVMGNQPLNQLHLKIGFDVFEHGIIKRRVTRTAGEENPAWKDGHPSLFPNILCVGSPWNYTFQWRVPMDDEHTFHVSMYTWVAKPGSEAPKQETVPYRMTPLWDEEGRWYVNHTFNQDFMAWVNQGPTHIAQRNMEKLGESDKGVILFRKLLKDQIKVLQSGGTPMNVFKSAEAADRIVFPQEGMSEPIEHFKPRGRNTKYVPQEAGFSADSEKIQAVIDTWVEAEKEPVSV